MYFINSGQRPAIGVQLRGYQDSTYFANPVYTKEDGAWQLHFTKAKPGAQLTFEVGKYDQYGTPLEVVNTHEITGYKMPAANTTQFKIIVCRKGERDEAATRYYQVIKASSEKALAKLKLSIDSLLAQDEKDHEQIALMFEKLSQYEKQGDSLSFYKAAYQIASINIDQANQRVLQYIAQLEQGVPLQVARQSLSLEAAGDNMDDGILLFEAALKELETRAGASKEIFDYQDAIKCYDTIIYYAEEMGIDGMRVAGFL